MHLVVLLGLSAVLATAQQSIESLRKPHSFPAANADLSPPFHLRTEDPDIDGYLFAGFLEMHSALITTATETGKSDGSENTPPPLILAWQRKLALTDSDFRTVSESASRLNAKLAELRHNVVVQVQSSATPLESTLMQAYYHDEVAAIANEITLLLQTLSHDGKLSVMTFVAGEFSKSVTRVSLPVSR